MTVETDRSTTTPEVGVAHPAVRASVALAASSAVVAVSAWWGWRLINDAVPLFIQAPPFAGTWAWEWPAGLWVAVVLAAVMVAVWVPATERLAWPAVLAVSTGLSGLWSVVLAASEGRNAVSAPLSTRFEYLPLARRVGDPAAFLRSFVDRLPTYPTHVKGHPPGAVLAYLGLDRLGLSDGAVAAVVLAVAASAAPAALIAVDRLAGRETARRAAVFVGLAPAVVWTATSTDAVFVGVTAWCVALGTVAVTTERRRAALAGLGTGLLGGALVGLTYGAPTLLGPLWAVAGWAAWRRAWWPLGAAVVGAVVVAGLLAAGGFNLLDGLSATRTAYLGGVAADRPYRYFLVAGLAALAVAVGPAAIVGVAWLRDRTVWLLVGGALAGAMVADLSGLSKGEVERIWLPLTPFLVVAAASIRGRNARRWWLGAQLGVAVVLQAWLRSPW